MAIPDGGPLSTVGRKRGFSKMERTTGPVSYTHLLCAISNTSGLAGIAHWINTYFKLKDDKQVEKSSPLVKEMKDWVDEEYAGGRVTVLTDGEIVARLNQICEEKHYTIG